MEHTQLAMQRTEHRSSLPTVQMDRTEHILRCTPEPATHSNCDRDRRNGFVCTLPNVVRSSVSRCKRHVAAIATTRCVAAGSPDMLAGGRIAGHARWPTAVSGAVGPIVRWLDRPRLGALCAEFEICELDGTA
jgi:hypothetical protein